MFCPAAHSFTGLLNQGLIKSLLDRKTKRGIKPGHQKGSARITHRAFEQAVSPSAQVGLPVLCPRDRGWGWDPYSFASQPIGGAHTVREVAPSSSLCQKQKSLWSSCRGAGPIFKWEQLRNTVEVLQCRAYPMAAAASCCWASRLFCLRSVKGSSIMAGTQVSWEEPSHTAQMWYIPAQWLWSTGRDYFGHGERLLALGPVPKYQLPVYSGCCSTADGKNVLCKPKSLRPVWKSGVTWTYSFMTQGIELGNIKNIIM